MLNGMRKVTSRGLEAIIEHEGLRLEAYRDVAGLLTIGVGHLLTRSELSSGKLYIGGQAVRYADGITKDQADQLLREDLGDAEAAVEGLAPGLTDRQFDALVSFVFNVGIRAFEKSTLLRRIHEGRHEAVPAELLRWNRAGGRVVAGLTRRRKAEGALWAG